MGNVLPNTITVSGDGDVAEYRRVDATNPQPLQPCAYSQRDDAWASIPLGTSSKTIGSHGCAMTAVTMLMTMINPELTPGSVGRWLNANGGYTGANLWWAKPTEMIDGIKFVNRYDWVRPPADMDIVREALEQNPQLIQVDFVPGGGPNEHWVLALGFTDDGKDINIIDPWTGRRGELLGTYGLATWDLPRAIYGMAEYKLER